MGGGGIQNPIQTIAWGHITFILNDASDVCQLRWPKVCPVKLLLSHGTKYLQKGDQSVGILSAEAWQSCSAVNVGNVYYFSAYLFSLRSGKQRKLRYVVHL